MKEGIRIDQKVAREVQEGLPIQQTNNPPKIPNSTSADVTFGGA